MTKLEAAALVAILVNAYPLAKFTVENAEVYERGIIDLGAKETQSAVEELIHTSGFLPSVAAIRSEVMRLRRLAVDAERNAQTLRLRGDDGRSIGPRPEGWAGPLKTLLEASSRNRAMAERWYTERGKPVPADPMARYVEVAKLGASGGDVRREFHETVLGDAEEQERRYP